MENQSQKNYAAHFAPLLYLKNLAAAIEYYKVAFDAIELRHFSNEDGSVHVAEMSIAGAWFRMHEETQRHRELSPVTVNATTVVIGLLVDDPDRFAQKAVEAGGTEQSPMQDYEYGYRQGTVIDPFGHHWQIEKDTRQSPVF